MAKKVCYGYILANGENGIVKTWNECKKKVLGVSSEYKGFSSEEDAKEWLLDNSEDTVDTGYEF